MYVGNRGQLQVSPLKGHSSCSLRLTVLELAKKTKLAGQGVSGPTRPYPLSSEIMGTHHHSCSGLIQTLMLAEKGLYKLNHLPAHEFIFLKFVFKKVD